MADGATFMHGDTVSFSQFSARAADQGKISRGGGRGPERVRRLAKKPYQHILDKLLIKS